MRLACQTTVTGDVKLRRLVLDATDLEITNQLFRRRLGQVGKSKDVAVLFSDIRGFTRLTETLSAYDVVFVLSRFFHHVGDAIERNGGFIVDFYGDGVMALFGLDDDPFEAATVAVFVGLIAGSMLESFGGSQWLSDASRSLVQTVIGACVVASIALIVGIAFGYLDRRERERFMTEMANELREAYANPDELREALELAEMGSDEGLDAIIESERGAGIDPDERWWR
jgi:class 3 adenylate cyclase